MAYWTDIFTLETWAQAAARSFNVTGFPAPTEGKGGYSRHMFERVEPGDVFVCYCKRPSACWVGALRVARGPFTSDEPVWGLTDSGEPRYPWRDEAEPIVTLDPARGLIAADTVWLTEDNAAPRASLTDGTLRWAAHNLLPTTTWALSDPDGQDEVANKLFGLGVLLGLWSAVVVASGGWALRAWAASA